MKKNILFILLFFAIVQGHAQSKLKIFTMNVAGKNSIKPSIFAFIAMVNMNENDWRNEMSYYYQQKCFESKCECYALNTVVDDEMITMEKCSDETIKMTYVGKGNLMSSLENELKPYFVKYYNGGSLYNLTLADDKSSYIFYLVIGEVYESCKIVKN
jgi:hypothetical protein